MEAKRPILTVTERACDRIRDFRSMSGNNVAAVRITVHPEAPVEGKYVLEFVDGKSALDGDIKVASEDLVFVLDHHSAQLLDGTRIDFREGMWSSGFHFDNPNRLKVMDDPLAVAVQRVINERIVPMVAIHGGSVSLVDVREQRAFVRFGGGCQGCGLASQTLKSGVIQMVHQEVPEIIEVIDVTDHAAGENPYFSKFSHKGPSAAMPVATGGKA